MEFIKNHICSLLFALLFCLPACNSHEANITDKDMNEMSFHVTESLPDGWQDMKKLHTRALPDEYDSIYVSSIYHYDDNSSSSWFYDLGIGKDSDGSWVAKDYYYPLKGSLDFIAYASTLPKSKYKASVSPKLLEVNNDFVSFDKLELDFGTVLDGQHDVLFTSRVSNENMPPTKSSLLFSHATSQLVFNLKPVDENAAEYLRVESITLDNANISGIVTINYNTVGESSVVWITTGAKSGISLPGFNTTQTFAANTPTQLADPYLILPIDPTVHKTSITLNYHFEGANDSQSKTFTYEFPSTPLWVPGNQYIYTFTCSLTLVEEDKEIEGNAEEEEWNVEIGGNAFEIHWNVEIQAAAMEQYWNSETGASANEESWSQETSANAYEEDWTEDPDGPINIPSE